MAASGTSVTELERMVVRIVGEGKQYEQVLGNAVRNTTKAADKIDKLTAEQLSKQNRSMEEAAKITQSLATPMERYQQGLAKVNELHNAGFLSAETHRRAISSLRDEYAKSGASRQIEERNKAMQDAARITRALQTPMQRYQQELARLNKLHRMNAISADVHGKALLMLQKEYKVGIYAATTNSKATEEQNRLMKEAAKITRSLAAPTQQYASRLARVSALHSKGYLDATIHAKAMRALRKEYVIGAYAVRAFGASMASVGRRMRSFGMMTSIAVTAPVVGMVTAWGSFEDALVKSTAIMSDVTADVRAEMERTANTIARGSVTSAKELADSYFFLASAGLNAKQSIAALPVVERFAVAGAFDMAQATDLLTDAQSALGLTVKDSDENMRNMVRVSDMLVKANTLANASVQQFSEAITNTAGAAINQYNIDLAEGVAILAAYADQGLKANAAGQMFGRMIRLLIHSVNENKQAFDDLGIQYHEFATTGKNVTQVIDGITRATAGMGPAQKAATLDALGFQSRIQQAILPLLGLTNKIRGYQAALEQAGGTTQLVADKQLSSFAAQMKILWNRITEVSREIGNRLAPYVRALSSYIDDAIDWWRGLSDATKEFVAVVAGLLALLGPLTMVFGGLTIAVGHFTWAVASMNTALSASSSLLAPIALAAGKIVAILAAAVAIVAGIVWAGKKVAAFASDLVNSTGTVKEGSTALDKMAVSLDTVAKAATAAEKAIAGVGVASDLQGLKGPDVPTGASYSALVDMAGAGSARDAAVIAANALADVAATDEVAAAALKKMAAANDTKKAAEVATKTLTAMAVEAVKAKDAVDDAAKSVHSTGPSVAGRFNTFLADFVDGWKAALAETFLGTDMALKLGVEQWAREESRAAQDNERWQRRVNITLEKQAGVRLRLQEAAKQEVRIIERLAAKEAQQLHYIRSQAALRERLAKRHEKAELEALDIVSKARAQAYAVDNTRTERETALIRLQQLGAHKYLDEVSRYYDKIAASAKKARLEESQMALVKGWQDDVKRYEDSLLTPFERAQKQIKELNKALMSHLIGWDLYIGKVHQVQGELAAASGGSAFEGPHGILAGSAEDFKLRLRQQVGGSREDTGKKLDVLTLVNKEQARSLTSIERAIKDQDTPVVVTMGGGG